jgi:mRNA-degrading endonuclease toxin of MazEF toxin-antitoxin module
VYDLLNTQHQETHHDRNRKGTTHIRALTGELIPAAPLRVRIEPGRLNNLRQLSDVMVDKLSAVPRNAVSEAFGRLSAAELASVDVAMRLLLEI